MMVDVITLNLLLSGLILHAFCHEGVDSELIGYLGIHIISKVGGVPDMDVSGCI
jgi:hypothetical protein